nr:MAG TPA: hypothetical protein [Caudoviricetes sp.]
MIQCSDLGLFLVVDYIIPYGSFVSSIYFEIYKNCLSKNPS